MTNSKASGSLSAEQIVEYYDHCWGGRLRAGHNARSKAIHYGLYLSADDDPQAAKLQTNHRIATLASIGPEPLRVLDAGCGIGGTAIDIAAKHPNLEIVGVTISDQQVQLASEHATEAGLSGRVTFANRDYAATELPDRSFDVVWAVESLCHSTDRRSFLDEARRLLRPGGRLIVADFFRTASPLDDEAAVLYGALCEGFAISDYYDESLTTIAEERRWRTVKCDVVTHGVLPDLKRSAGTAAARLEAASDELTDLGRAHLLTCTLVYAFCLRGLLEYHHYRLEPT